MPRDEQEIRQLVTTWMNATKAGDADTVLSLVSDDVVFLRAGHLPMRKDEFAAQARAQAGPDAPLIEGSSQILEIKVLGDWAFMMTQITVAITPSGGAPVTKRMGHTLTILNKQNGKWLLARDANLLAPIPV